MIDSPIISLYSKQITLIEQDYTYYGNVMKWGAQETDLCGEWTHRRSSSTNAWILKVDSVEFNGVRINGFTEVTS
jgi:hypothetical protein